jgi:hypothetical protein
MTQHPHLRQKVWVEGTFANLWADAAEHALQNEVMMTHDVAAGKRPVEGCRLNREN